MSATINFSTGNDTIYPLPFLATGDANVTAVDSGGMCTVKGIQTDYSGIVESEFFIRINNYTGPGTYRLSDTGSTSYFFYSSYNPNITISGLGFSSGQIVINVNNEEISGTFNVIVVFNAPFVNGKFLAKGMGF